MFDLNTAISAWKQALEYNRIYTPDDIEELESHIREQVATLVRDGAEEETAFRTTIRDMGDLGLAETEYKKVFVGKMLKGDNLRRETRWQAGMLLNYVKISLRNIRRHTVFSAINVVGLGLGMGAALLILLFVNFETSYDDFHENGDQLYRVRVDSYHPDRPPMQFAVAYPAVGWQMVDEFPEVVASARLARFFPDGIVMAYHDPSGVAVKQHVDNLYYADSTLFTMFSYEFIVGDPGKALTRPETTVISESLAGRFFGRTDVLGERISMDGGDEFEITGVFADIPENSHLAFDALFSYSTMRAWGNHTEFNWGWWDFYTYVQLAPWSDILQLQAKMPDFIETLGDRPSTGAMRTEFVLQAVPDIHLKSNVSYEAKENGNATAVAFLMRIAGLILCVAWINYVNLTTARAMDRAREVGMRKTLGATRPQLLQQFILESAMTNLAAIAVGLLFAFLALPYFSELFRRPLAIGQISSGTMVMIGVIAILGSLLAGTYPASILSAYRPISVLKSQLGGTGVTPWSRKGMVIAQVSAAAFLLTSTLAVNQQIRFMQTSNLGFNLDQVLVIESPSDIGGNGPERLDILTAQLRERVGVQNVSAASAVPGGKINSSTMYNVEGGNDESATNLRRLWVDESYVETLGITLLAGRTFDRDLASDSSAVLINASAVDALGIIDPEEALDQIVINDQTQYHVVGVVDDYHQQPLRYSHDPIIFLHSQDARGYLITHLKASEAGVLSNLMAEIESAWLQVYPGNLYNAYFLDDHFNAQY